jgi:hypothetical protein
MAKAKEEKGINAIKFIAIKEQYIQFVGELACGRRSHST